MMPLRTVMLSNKRFHTGDLVYQIPPRGCVPLKRSGSRFGTAFVWCFRMQIKASIADEEALSCPSTPGQIIGLHPGFATGILHTHACAAHYIPRAHYIMFCAQQEAFKCSSTARWPNHPL